MTRTRNRRPPEVIVAASAEVAEAAANPFAQRDVLLDDRRKVRIATDATRARRQHLEAERRLAMDAAFVAEQEILLERDGAAERRDEAVATVAQCDADIAQTERAVAAAAELQQITEAKTTDMYDSGFDQFVVEAQSAAANAERQLRELRKQAVVAAQAWAKASSLWRPLQKPLFSRLQELDHVQGVWGDTVAQSHVRDFPVDLTLLVNAAPRPTGIERLRAAEKNGTA